VLTPVLIALVVAGCGSSSSSSSTSEEEKAPASSTPSETSSTETSSSSESSSGGGETIKEEADPSGELKFTNTALSAKAGKVTVDFTNMSAEGHNMTIESSSGETVAASPTFSGGSKSFTANLKAGTYKFYCSVPGHRQGGMEGTLTVK
jgi:plastocyanin